MPTKIESLPETIGAQCIKKNGLIKDTTICTTCVHYSKCLGILLTGKEVAISLVPVEDPVILKYLNSQLEHKKEEKDEILEILNKELEEERATKKPEKEEEEEGS